MIKANFAIQESKTKKTLLGKTKTEYKILHNFRIETNNYEYLFSIATDVFNEFLKHKGLREIDGDSLIELVMR